MKALTVKLITGLIASSAIVVIGSVSHMTHEYNKQMNTSQSAIAEKVTVDLQDYFGGYMDQSASKIKVLENTVEEIQQDTTGITLSQEQIDEIISGVISQVTPDLLKQVTSSDKIVTQETITTLEKEIDAKLKSIVPEGTISEGEMQALTDSISVIVESNIMKELSQNDNVSENDLKTLQESIESKLKMINSTIDAYEGKIDTLQKELDSLKEKGASEAELDALETRITNAYKNLENFATNSSKAVTIIDNLMTEYGTEGGVVSAEAGHEMLVGLQDLNARITVKTEEINSMKEALQAKDEEILKKIADNTETIDTINQTTESLDAAIKSVDDALTAEGNERE